MSNLSVIILAAGRGSRLLRDLYNNKECSRPSEELLPKPLQLFCGKPIIEWLIEALLECLPETTNIFCSCRHQSTSVLPPVRKVWTWENSFLYPI